jgi:hypothetical protein
MHTFKDHYITFDHYITQIMPESLFIIDFVVIIVMIKLTKEESELQILW